jgi:BlaI family penicillinase repressor
LAALVGFAAAAIFCLLFWITVVISRQTLFNQSFENMTLKRIPRISDAEWEVMKVLWKRAPLPASEIVEALLQTERWHPKTVKTLLNRLVKKGVLEFTQEGRAYLYRPAVSESAGATAASQAFLDRVFGGSLKPMLAHFVEHKRLTPKEMNELRRILGEKE